MNARISYHRPPSVNRVQKAIGRLARHEHFGEHLTPDDAHSIASVFFAANFALRRDCLPATWSRHRHIAAKCGELYSRVEAMNAFRGHNCPPQVDINF